MTVISTALRKSDLCLGIINCGLERALDFAEQIELP